MQKYNPLLLDDFMPFGKHEGEQIEDLIEDEPQYMAWVANNEVVELDKEVIELMAERKII